MLQQVHKNVFIYKFLSSISPAGFSNYTICYVSFRSREEKGYFGSYDNDDFRPKTEGRIVVKAWKELSTYFPLCILGDHSITPDTFSGIIMIDNSQALENPEKYIPKILTGFKNRSTKLLNQFHGTHGRVFWENAYEEIKIDSIESFNQTLNLLKAV